MNIKMIVAHDENLGIGLNGTLPWNNIDELLHFRNETLFSAVIVGSKTYENLPILRDRKVVVLSTNSDIELKCDSHILSNSVEDALEKARMMSETNDIFIIGGAKVYEEFKNYYTHIIVSLVYGDYKVDTKLFDYTNMKNLQMKNCEYKDGFEVRRYAVKVI